MALVTTGPYLGFSGSVGEITYSLQKNGTTVASKKNKKRTLPATVKQQVIMDETAIFSKAMRPLKEFVHVGYALEGQKTGRNPYNAMVSATRKNVFQGEVLTKARPFDFSQLLITKGDMPIVEAAHAEMTYFGIAFTWSPEIITSVTHYSDQVIMMAYFPDLQEARYITSGAQRFLGKDLLRLEGIKKGYTAEIYISFISNDHKGISNSTYLGQLDW